MLKGRNHGMDWVRVLAVLFGAAVIVPSVISLSISLVTVAATLF